MKAGRWILQRRDTLFVALLVLLSILAFLPAALHAPFLRLDDSYLIVQNTAVVHPSPHALRTVFTTYDPELYIPATFISYQLDVLLGGVSPLIFHLHNLLLHILNGILVFILLRQLGIRRWIAEIAALLFLIHPVQTEAVLWVAARKDLQSSFFLLLSLIAYKRWSDATDGGSWYLLSLACFALALLSKVTVATLPLLLLLIDYARDWQFRPRILLVQLPFYLLSLFFVIVAFAGKTAAITRITPAMTVLLTTQSFIASLARLIIPLHLRPIYIVAQWESFSAVALLCGLLTIGLLMAAWWLLRHHKQRGFWMVAVFVLFAPSAFTLWKDGVVYLASDRYLYLVIVPYAVCLLECTAVAFSPFVRDVHPATRVRTGICIAVLVLAIVVFSTFRQATIWRSDAALSLAVLEYEPESHVAHMNLGNEFLSQQRYRDAAAQYLAAISASPRYAPAYRNLGTLLLMTNQENAAITYFRTALALSPDGMEAHQGIGLALLAAGDLTHAEAQLRQAINGKPTLMDAYIALGEIYYRRNEPAQERGIYEQALAVDPWYLPAQQNLAVVIREQSK